MKLHFVSRGRGSDISGVISSRTGRGRVGMLRDEEGWGSPAGGATQFVMMTIWYEEKPCIEGASRATGSAPLPRIMKHLHHGLNGQQKNPCV